MENGDCKIRSASATPSDLQYKDLQYRLGKSEEELLVEVLCNKNLSLQLTVRSPYKDIHYILGKSVKKLVVEVLCNSDLLL